MKLELNMYVRTKWGYICKLININDFREPSMRYGIEANYLRDVMFIGDEDILKASYNIIDILEVGDYVNGIRVNKIEREDDGVFITIGTITNFVSKKEENPYLTGGVDGNNERLYQLKSIVTSQQFESISYKAGDSNE